MKTKWIILAGGLCAGSLLHGQGYIVANGVVTNLFAGEIDLNWPAETQVNGFTFTPVGKTSGVYTNVFTFEEPATIGVRVFLISSNQPLTLDIVNSSTYSEISDSLSPIYPSNPTNIFNANTPFYVGLYSGAQYPQYYPPGNTTPVQYIDAVFGWAELENVGGTIQLLGGALEYGGLGIYAGTQNIIQAVPEPGTLVLAAFGGLLLGCRRFKKMK